MDLYDVAVARKLSSGGGGGSSDFSTAEVAVNGLIDVYAPIILEYGEYTFISTGYTELDDGETYSIVLYKGSALMSSDGIDNISGDIVLIDEDEGVYQITGNCTISARK